MNKMEQEVVYLTAAIELIESMVNKAMFSVEGDGENKNVWFKSFTHRQFFSIALVDFLSTTDKDAPVPKTSYLNALRTIANAPSLEQFGSVAHLKQAVDSFSSWLDTEIEVDAWFSSIDRQLALKISRCLLLKIGGNLSKHNFLRSIGVAKDVQRLLSNAGAEIELHQAILLQPEIYDLFHDDVAAYHASTIAEFLNELWWGIHIYLIPEFNRSIIHYYDDTGRYEYQYPSALTHPFGKSCYWNLMNQILRKPYFERFTITRHLKGNY
ncbi:hypothetical protein [Pseudomonas chlororaphis]|uniref:hypothetical protein n=1 Tax=Pseudomonas chlororaphis TaxID=587753 RepID=UPI001F28D061|nr:hypothetical protein [Pseudomonas chlororaphis]